VRQGCKKEVVGGRVHTHTHTHTQEGGPYYFKAEWDVRREMCEEGSIYGGGRHTVLQQSVTNRL